MVTNPALYQWVDLGVLSEACITRPDTCGPEGAAVAVWVKIHSCPNADGFFTSLQRHSSSVKTGFGFFCFSASIRYVLMDGTFFIVVGYLKELFHDEEYHLSAAVNIGCQPLTEIPNVPLLTYLLKMVADPSKSVYTSWIAPLIQNFKNNTLVAKCEQPSCCFF